MSLKNKSIKDLKKMLWYTLMRLKLIKKGTSSKEYWKWRSERDLLKEELYKRLWKKNLNK